MMCIGLLVMWCQTAPPAVVSDYCQIARPVKVSRQDTPETIRQASIEWRKYRRLCPAVGAAK